jgi:hypothetical protein
VRVIINRESVLRRIGYRLMDSLSRASASVGMIGLLHRVRDLPIEFTDKKKEMRGFELVPHNTSEAIVAIDIYGNSKLR